MQHLSEGEAREHCARREKKEDTGGVDGSGSV